VAAAFVNTLGLNYLAGQARSIAGLLGEALEVRVQAGNGSTAGSADMVAGGLRSSLVQRIQVKTGPPQ
jgi:hypothetical protein